MLPILAGVSRAACHIFYRLDISGPTAPAKGPVLLFANHPNSLLDPALVSVAAARPVRFLAKSTLFDDRRVGWLVRASGAIPVYRRSDDEEAAERNVDMFEAVWRELAAGSAVGIFPEGISHGFSALTRLKTGASRIALGASREGAFPLVPVGLVLRDKGVFRSEARVIRGPAIDWSDLAGRAPEDRDAVQELTGRLERSLSEVTLNLERWEDQPLIDCAEAIWAAELVADRETDEPLQRAQTAAQVLADFRRRGDGDWQRLAFDVLRHRRHLDWFGLEAADLKVRTDLAAGLGWTLRQLPLFGPPLSLAGMAGALLFWLPYRLTALIVARLRPQSEQSATYKVLVGAAVYSLWIAVLAAMVGRVAGLWAAVLVALSLPLLGTAGLWVSERWRGAWKEARRYLLLRSRRERWDRLRREQADLGRRLQSAYESWQQMGTSD